jgi:GT2 family glycosyltransferase
MIDLSAKPMPIDWTEGRLEGNEVFSIVIPTWNNLEFLKLCVRSIRQNSSFSHQIVLHVNDGADGTLEWARREGLSFSHTPENVGICLGLNAARALVRTDYFLYMNDDMYVCPGWDAALKEEIEKAGTKYFFISATMIEPNPTSSLPVIGGKNFGTTVDSFEEARLLKEFGAFPKPDWSGATRPPNVVHKEIWDLVGGYSLELSPGLYSDPDFSMKLWQAGVRYFKGVGRSRVYHFVSKSLGRVSPNPGHKQFLVKWGITPATFYRFFIKKGQLFEGPLKEPVIEGKFRLRLLKDALERFTSSLSP